MKKQNKFFVIFFSATLLCVLMFYQPGAAHAQLGWDWINWDLTTGAAVGVSDAVTEAASSLSCVTSFGGFSDCVLKAFADFIQWINTALIGNLIWIVAGAINIVLQFTTFVDNDAINTGWTIMRDFANMFFILVMLWISIVTILDLPQYQTQKLLAGVIMIAVLINFSRVIAFTVVDFSHVFLNAFLNAFKNTQGQVDVAGYLGDALQIKTLVPDPQQGGGSLAATSQSSISYGGLLATVLFHTIILTVILAALIAAVFLFIARMIILWALVMLSPLAFIGRILPAKVKAQTWDKWWPALFSWSFVAPIYMFFIYITVKLAGPNGVLSLIQQSNQSSVLASGAAGANVIPFVNNMTVGNLIVMVVVIGFLLLGLKMSLGIAGATGGAIVSLGTKGLSMVGGGVAWGMRQGARRYAENKLEKYEKDPPKTRFGQITAGMATRFLAPVQAADAADIKKMKDQYSNFSPAQLRAVRASTTPIERTKKLALSALLAEKGELKVANGVNNSMIINDLKSLKTVGMHKDVLKARPDLAEHVGETMEKVMQTFKSKEDFTKLQFKDIADSSRQDADKIVQAILQTSRSGKQLGWAAEGNLPLAGHIADTVQNLGTDYDSRKANFMQKFANKDPNTGKITNEGVVTYLGSGAAQDVFGFGEAPKQGKGKGAKGTPPPNPSWNVP